MPKRASNHFRKPGLAGKIQKLLPEQREEIWSWLQNDGLPYEAVKARALQKFGVETSLTALSNFWSREHERRLLDRTEQKNGTEIILDVSFPAATRLQVVRIGGALQLQTSQPLQQN